MGIIYPKPCSIYLRGTIPLCKKLPGRCDGIETDLPLLWIWSSGLERLGKFEVSYPNMCPLSGLGSLYSGRIPGQSPVSADGHGWLPVNRTISIIWGLGLGLAMLSGNF